MGRAQGSNATRSASSRTRCQIILQRTMPTSLQETRTCRPSTGEVLDRERRGYGLKVPLSAVRLVPRAPWALQSRRASVSFLQASQPTLLLSVWSLVPLMLVPRMSYYPVEANHIAAQKFHRRIRFFFLICLSALNPGCLYSVAFLRQITLLLSGVCRYRP